jgi:hypothetical protein
MGVEASATGGGGGGRSRRRGLVRADRRRAGRQCGEGLSRAHPRVPAGDPGDRPAQRRVVALLRGQEADEAGLDVVVGRRIVKRRQHLDDVALVGAQAHEVPVVQLHHHEAVGRGHQAVVA